MHVLNALPDKAEIKEEQIAGQSDESK